ncbi:MAG: NAD(P) transhydrogenase subunit beta [Alphaproteobacteria bacterium MarineAlpha5_Bin8]|nr:MAG: NAD(P) transhydrogenase subunit beta [Alphaproteobacteria bacterium MarineAlpha5_Bin7]PPR48108.1 MAG: NAD(P) transhydrogenase subunit beta [Alphaproteobacteria bacterium MarineAlpha5_Bin8]PPR54314.1 MAG: NAD(P) transhydrogenase subunit beta [Alphaproteobacteria bacterium MarineAlpha5_Bin6]|tara:strand:- start:3937 stop:5328 length:1392 start_codon:yes stop_codon:yes gene_type:complete
MSNNLVAFMYLISALLFIFALRGLSHPESSRKGNIFGIIGMIIAIITTLMFKSVLSYAEIGAAILVGGVIGTTIALRIEMTALPQLVAAFHSLVGLAAVFVAAAAFYDPASFDIGVIGSINESSLIEMSIGTFIGAITFSGSVLAFGKLQGTISGKPIVYRFQHTINAIIFLFIVFLIIIFVLDQSPSIFWSIVIISIILGILVVIPIGGADMPVVVSMLNSYSGWAACGIGFTLSNNLLIITGALVGASGAILSYIMSKGMNRSIINVVLGGFGGEKDISSSQNSEDKIIKKGNAEDAAYILKNADSVIIVPGYGMAVAQAQHALKEMSDILKKEGIIVRYAIHPVAGRMPGHMNVLLAEANVPYEEVLELEEINPDFPMTEVSFVIGANDVTNPAAKTDETSPIYGMPILDVEKSQTVLFIKRSMATGYSGVENELFYRDNTTMLFGDAKKMCENIVKSLN